MSNKKTKTIKTVEQEEASDVSSKSTAEDLNEEDDAEDDEEENDFQVPDVPNDKVRESLTDMIEYYTEMAFLDRRKRLENMQAADVRIST
jgi:hypothetical protein